MKLRLYNTLTRKVEEVVPTDKEKNVLRMYNCGPTVYSRQHIGNYRAFTEWDILHRALLYLGYEVDRITNITDVGHMTADEDFGDDKMEKSAKERGKQPLDIANEIIVTFLEDLQALNVLHPDGMPITDEDIDPSKVKGHGWTRATEYVQEMIDTIKKIEESGMTYETEQALYFDVTKYPDYSALSRQDLSEKEVGARDDVNVDPEKKNPADFVLWMKLVGKYENHIMKWESPWGVGFPGWHIECSAMGCTELGEYIDIHTGGHEHIGVHHTNEKAQNFGAFGHDVVKMWVHNAWLVGKKGEKMSKSKGSIYTVPELVEMGFDPLDLRYYYLSVKYRKPLYFSLEGLESAKSSRSSLVQRVAALIGADDPEDDVQLERAAELTEFKTRFTEVIADDLNIPGAFAVLNDLLGSENDKYEILRTVDSFDQVLGLKLLETAEQYKKELFVTGDAHPKWMEELLEKRNEARKDGDYARSDELREEARSKGFDIVDTPEGEQQVKKIK